MPHLPGVYLSIVGHECEAALLCNPEPRPAVLPLQVSACQQLPVVLPKFRRLRRPAAAFDNHVAQLCLQRYAVSGIVADMSRVSTCRGTRLC